MFGPYIIYYKIRMYTEILFKKSQVFYHMLSGHSKVATVDTIL